MPELDILPTPRGVDMVSPSRVSRLFRRFSSQTSPPTQHKTLFSGKASSVQVDISHGADDDSDIIIPGLPPLLRGHPDVHLRDGVIRSARLAAAGEPDAESAYFVADLSQVYRQHDRWKRLLPEIEPFYAVKCNPDPYVLRLLAALGTGFDCASHGEISQVLRTDVCPDRIIFANPCKAVSFIKNAARSGVNVMTFDNADELYKVARANPSAQLVLRILTDDSKSLCRLGLKFGAPLVTVPGLLAKARELRLNVIGISFHVGSGCYDSSAFADAIGCARTAFDMGLAAGYEFTLLDVGGGFEDATFEETADVLRNAIDLQFPDRAGLRIIAEPGRFFVARAFTLATNIIARRARSDGATTEVQDEGDDQPSVMYYINEGVYGSFNCILFDHQEVHPYVLSMNGSFHLVGTEDLRTCSIWGPTCDSVDCVCPMTKLPAELRVGDWLVFNNMGAYTICAASQFNGFAVSPITYTTGDGLGSQETWRVLKPAVNAANA
ncbi:pyridoxal-dependent decarboxylase [Lactarius hengduanensis]|nr:pyridoxal-dependent decarboxylase [Lactarius hengduanensis]